MSFGGGGTHGTGNLLLARAIVEIGATGLPDTQREIAALQGRLQVLQQQYQQGMVTLRQYTDGTIVLTRRISELERALGTADQYVARFGSTTAASAAMARQLQTQMSGLSGMGVMGFMALSNAIDDVQYGFHSIVNNIPMIVTGFGSLFGMTPQAAMMAGAIGQIGAVLVNFMIPYVQQAAKDFGLMGSEVDKAVGHINRLAAELKEIESKPIKLAVDVVREREIKGQLEDFHKGLAGFERAQEGLSPDQKEAGNEAKKAFEETGRMQKILGDMAARGTAEIEASSGPLQEQLDLMEKAKKRQQELQEMRKNPLQVEGMGGAFNVEMMIGEEQKKIDAAKDKADKIRDSIGQGVRAGTGQRLNDLFTGKGVHRENIARELEKTDPELAKRIREATPENARKERFRKADEPFHAEAQHMKEENFKEERDRLSRDVRDPMRRKMLEGQFWDFARGDGTKIDREQLADSVAQGMDRAGIKPRAGTVKDQSKAIAEELAKSFEAEVDKRAAEKGITRAQALAEFEIEQARNDKKTLEGRQQQAKDDLGIKDAHIGTVIDYSNKLLLTGLNQSPIANLQLDQQKEGNKTLLDCRDFLKDLLEKFADTFVGGHFNK